MFEEIIFLFKLDKHGLRDSAVGTVCKKSLIRFDIFSTLSYLRFFFRFVTSTNIIYTNLVIIMKTNWSTINPLRILCINNWPSISCSFIWIRRFGWIAVSSICISIKYISRVVLISINILMNNSCIRSKILIFISSRIGNLPMCIQCNLYRDSFNFIFIPGWLETVIVYGPYTISCIIVFRSIFRQWEKVTFSFACRHK